MLQSLELLHHAEKFRKSHTTLSSFYNKVTFQLRLGPLYSNDDIINIITFLIFPEFSAWFLIKRVLIKKLSVYVFGSSTHGEWLFWSHSILFTLWLKRVEKHFYPLILTLIHCVVAVSHFFASGQKYFSVLKNITIWILKYFKCVAISHPLNPGATPWYVTSYSNSPSLFFFLMSICLQKTQKIS